MAILSSGLRSYRISSALEPLLIRKVDSSVRSVPGAGCPWTSAKVPPPDRGKDLLHSRQTCRIIYW